MINGNMEAAAQNSSYFRASGLFVHSSYMYGRVNGQFQVGSDILRNIV